MGGTRLGRWEGTRREGVMGEAGSRGGGYERGRWGGGGGGGGVAGEPPPATGKEQGVKGGEGGAVGLKPNGQNSRTWIYNAICCVGRDKNWPVLCFLAEMPVSVDFNIYLYPLLSQSIKH